MTDKLVLLLASDEQWRLGVMKDDTAHVLSVELPDNPTAKQVAERVAACLNGSSRNDTSQTPANNTFDSVADQMVTAHVTADNGVVLGVPSAWCLCGTITVPDLPAKQKRTAMLFALEEKLPVPAEDVVADFIEVDHTALGVAVESLRLRTLIDTLEEAGIRIDAICPTALLAFQHLEPDVTSLTWRDTDGLNLFELCTDSRLEHWRWLKNTPGNPAPRISGATANIAPSPGLTDPESAWLSTHLSPEETPHHQDAPTLSEAACQTAERILSGQIEPLINLRRDGLDAKDRFRNVRGHLAAVMTAAAVLLLAVTGACLWRAHLYQASEQRYESAITALYHDTFGDQPRPTSVKRRFSTKLRELKGLRGEEVEDTQDLATTSALWPLYSMLERMPTDKRLCLLDINIESDHLTIVGQAKSHSDADRIASELRQGGRFEVQPPSTNNLKDGGVSFTLHCTVIEPPASTPTSPANVTEIASVTARERGDTDRRLSP